MLLKSCLNYKNSKLIHGINISKPKATISVLPETSIYQAIKYRETISVRKKASISATIECISN